MSATENNSAQRQRRFLLCATFALAGLLLSAAMPALQAKEKREKPSRTVTGLISDESENPISGAVVTLADTDSGKKLVSYTGDDGRYSFSGLELTHNYEVQATHNDVASRVRKVTPIDPRNRITINLQIPPPKEEE